MFKIFSNKKQSADKNTAQLKANETTASNSPVNVSSYLNENIIDYAFRFQNLLIC
jgi:hypothetical protein